MSPGRRIACGERSITPLTERPRWWTYWWQAKIVGKRRERKRTLSSRDSRDAIKERERTPLTAVAWKEARLRVF